MRIALMLLIDMYWGQMPKRGDLVQTNVGSRRERTWIVLHCHQIKGNPRRYKVWAVRWWELEPEFRQALYRSAQRNGGQRTIFFHRYHRQKPKRSNQLEWM